MVAQLVKNLPAMRETWIRSPGWEDPLEEGMATHSSILAWGTPSTEDNDRSYLLGNIRDADKETDCGYGVGGGGGRRVWDEWRMESNMEAYILPCIKQITNGNLLCDSRNSNQGSVTT